MNKLLSALVGVALVLGAGALFLQRASNDELRAEVAALRAEVEQVTKAQKDAGTLRAASTGQAGQTAAIDNAAANEQRTELASLREEFTALKKSTAQLAQQAQAAVQAARGESPVPVK